MTGNIRYYLCYNTPVGTRPDGTFVMRKGKQMLHHSETDQEFGIGVCKAMIGMYGEGTHWLEDETGETVFPVDDHLTQKKDAE